MKRFPILYLHSSSDLYGSDQSLLHMVRGLDRTRFEPLLVVPRPGPLVERLQTLGIEVIPHHLSVLHRTADPLHWGRFLAGLGPSALFLARLARQRRVALIHSNSSHVLDGGLLAGLSGLPHVWHVREIHSTQPALVRELLPRIIVRLSTAQVAISEAVRQTFFGQAASSDKIVTIYNGIDLEEFDPNERGEGVRAELGLSATTPVLAMVGRIARWKGQDVFLKAAAQVHAAMPQVRFVIAGGPVVRDDELFQVELVEMVRDLGLAQVVIFTGVRGDVPSILAACSGLVLPSVSPEPFGRVVLEAMAAARPVIATAHGGPLEIVVPGESGWLVPPSDPDALAQAMIELLAAPERAQAMGQAGRARCAQHFSLARTMNGINTLYARLLHLSQE